MLIALQPPLPEISESPWWEEGQSLNKPPPVPREPGMPGQFWGGTGVGGGYEQPGGWGGQVYSGHDRGQYPGGRQGRKMSHESCL